MRIKSCANTKVQQAGKIIRGSYHNTKQPNKKQYKNSLESAK